MIPKKKILIVSSAFYPENSPRSFRATELVKEMCRQGHQVTLLTYKKDAFHVPLEKEFAVLIKDLGKQRLTPIEIAKGRGPVLLFKRILNRALLQLIEYPAIELMFKVKTALKKESGYDLLISIAVPHTIHWGVAWARTGEHPIAETWVADCGDPYMGTILDSFKKMFYFKYFEKSFCRKADYISVPKIAMKENYYPEFRDKIIEIPQGFKFGDVQVKSGSFHNRVPHFAFAGTFIKTLRNPTPLLQYLVTLKKDFRFIVYTQTPDLLLPFKTGLGEKLEIKNYIPRPDLIQELSTMDFLINLGYDPVHQAPSKLIDYYLAGRPTLSFNNNDINETLLDQFLEADYSQAFSYSNVEQYKIENVCTTFLGLRHPDAS